MQTVDDKMRLARVIAEGRAIEALDGAAHAWVYMTAHGVAAATIRRVLADAGRQQEAAIAQPA